MMQQCPKCGFVQPADRYCASCGLDIENFKPVPESLVKKLVRNTYFHLSILAIVVVALISFIYIEQKNKILDHLKSVGQSAGIVSQSTVNTAETNTPTTNEEINKAELADTQTPTTTAAPDTDPNLTSTESTELAGAAAAKTDTKKTAAILAKKIKISFVEISTNVLQQVLSEGQLVNETAQRRAFTHTSFDSIDKLKEKDPDFRVLPGAQSKNLRLNNSTAFDFSHISSSNEEVGLNFDVTPVANTEANIEINVAGTLHLKDENRATLTNHEFNANFSFSPKSTLILIGYLPHQAINPEDQEFFNNTPLVIYDSLSFTNGLTEFAIFIQAE